MDLLAALGNWRQVAKWLILFIDANEDTTKGPLNSALTGNNIQMREAVCSHHLSPLATPTFKSGSHLGKAPIDAAFLTPDPPSLLAHGYPFSTVPEITTFVFSKSNGRPW